MEGSNEKISVREFFPWIATISVVAVRRSRRNITVWQQRIPAFAGMTILIFRRKDNFDIGYFLHF
jgi:hypothetical protein